MSHSSHWNRPSLFTAPAHPAQHPDFVTLLRAVDERGNPVRANKTIRRGAGGQIVKERTAEHGRFRAEVRRVDDDAAFASLLREIGDDPAALLCCAFPVGLEPGPGENCGPAFLVLPAAVLGKALGLSALVVDARGQALTDAVAHVWQWGDDVVTPRLKQHWRASSWLPFDFDASDGMPPDMAQALARDDLRDDLMATILPCWPDLRRVTVGSTSTRIMIGGEPLKAIGAHTFVQADTDLRDRASEALGLLAAAAGYAFQKPLFHRTGEAAGQQLGSTPWIPFDPSVLRNRISVSYDGAPTTLDEMPPDAAGWHPITALPQAPVATPGRRLTASDFRAIDDALVNEANQRLPAGARYSRTPDAGGALRAVVTRETLALDDVLETQSGKRTLRDIALAGQRVRCQAHWRGSTSWNAYVSFHADGSPFVFDNGIGEKLVLRPEARREWLKAFIGSPRAPSLPVEEVGLDAATHRIRGAVGAFLQRAEAHHAGVEARDRRLRALRRDIYRRLVGAYPAENADVLAEVVNERRLLHDELGIAFDEAVEARSVTQDFLPLNRRSLNAQARREARRIVEQERREALARLGELDDGGVQQRDEPPRTVIAATTGAGKTHVTVAEIVATVHRRRERGLAHRVVVHVPRHDLAEQMLATIRDAASHSGVRITAAIYRGRGAADPDPAATDAAAAAAVSAAGRRGVLMMPHTARVMRDGAIMDTPAMCRALPVAAAASGLLQDEAAVCGPAGGAEDGRSCVWRDACPYRAQAPFAAGADIVIAAHEFLVSPLPEAVTRGAFLVITDEAFWGALLKTYWLPHGVFDEANLRAAPPKTGIGAARTIAWNDERFLRGLHAKVRTLLSRWGSGPLTGAMLAEAGITLMDARRACEVEMSRRIDGLFSADDARAPEERIAAARERAGVNGHLIALAAFWSEVARILDPAVAYDASARLVAGLTPPAVGDAWRARVESPSIRIMAPPRLAAGVRHLPLLALDATPPEFLADLLPGLETVRVDVAAPHADVTQVVGKWGKRSLREDGRWQDIADRVAALRLKHAGGVVGVIVHREARVGVADQGDEPRAGGDEVDRFLALLPHAPPGAATVIAMHHGAVTGLNALETCSALVVVGAPEPSPDDVEALAAHLWGGVPPPSSTGSVAVGARLRGGGGATITARRHGDARAEMIRAAISDAAAEQALGRGRLVRRTAADPVEVLFLGNALLRGAVDRVVHDEVAQFDRTARLLARGVVPVASQDIVQARPDLFKANAKPDAAWREAAAMSRIAKAGGRVEAAWPAGFAQGLGAPLGLPGQWRVLTYRPAPSDRWGGLRRPCKRAVLVPAKVVAITGIQFEPDAAFQDLRKWVGGIMGHEIDLQADALPEIDLGRRVRAARHLLENIGPDYFEFVRREMADAPSKQVAESLWRRMDAIAWSFFTRAGLDDAAASAEAARFLDRWIEGLCRSHGLRG